MHTQTFTVLSLFYNHATSNLAIYSRKHLKISCQKHKIDCLLLSSSCMTNYMKIINFYMLIFFFWIDGKGWEFVLKKLMVKNSFIEKTCVVGTYWKCPIEAIPMCTYNICYWKYGRKLFRNWHFPSIMSIVFTNFKHPKVRNSIKIPVTLLQIVCICMTAISPNSSSWTTSLLTC